MQESCPGAEDYLNLQSDTSLRDRILEHAVECRRCLALLEVVEEGVELGILEPPSHAGRLKAWAAAAGMLLAVAGTLYMLGSPPPARSPSRPFSLPSGDPVGARGGEWVTDAQTWRSVRLPDGTRLRIEPETVCRLLPGLGGERAHLHVDRGAVEAEVPPGNGTFRIVAPAGEVRVLGTYFRVKAFSLRGGLPCLCAEVYEGRIRLEGRDRQALVSGGERGLLVGKRLESQSLGGTARGVLEMFGRQVRQATDGRDQADLLAALFVGGRWPDAVNLEESADDTDLLREAKQALKERIE